MLPFHQFTVVPCRIASEDVQMTSSPRKLKLGFVGIGIGAAAILPQADAMPDEIEVSAGADINARVRQAFAQRYPEARVYDTAEALLGDPDIEAVWIATPNRLHPEQAILAANNGKHIVVEKPMALTLADADRMIEAADRAGVKMLCGHTQGFMPQVRAMRRVVKSGRLGRVKFVSSTAYTDWMVSPRAGDEADLSAGGGLIYRQVPHQADTIRLLGDGKLKSLTASVGQWADWRPKTPGFYTAFMQFDNDAVAQMTYNGYGYFLTQELVDWSTDESANGTPSERGNVRDQLRSGDRPEDDLKDQGRIGGSNQQAPRQARSSADAARGRQWVPGNTGLVLVSCEGGDIRYSRYGITVYSDAGRDEQTVEEAYLPGREDLAELYEAAVHDRTVYHDGPWGMATLEISLAMMQSSREGREVELSHQVKMPDEYDMAVQPRSS